MTAADRNHATPAERPYDGLRVLVVEDNERTADLLVTSLKILGADILGPATDLADGLNLACYRDFDFAILDVDLGPGSTSLPIATVLDQRAIPFVFMTNESAPHLGRHAGHPCYDKLVRPHEVGRVLAEHMKA